MVEYNGKEKRSGPRISANFIISYHIQEMVDGYDLSQTKNISQGGVLITTNKPFAKGALLEMIMRIPFISQKIMLKGEVVDSSERVRDLIYETRIKFLNLPDDFFTKLGKFIKENIK